MYIKRHMEQAILEASSQYPVVMLCGQRQVGKSTMLDHLRTADRKYVTFDDANARSLAERDPALFLEAYGAPLMIDEFQRVPSVLLEIKNIVDKKAMSGEDNTGMFWLTGSQKFRMMKGVSESLAGRAAVFELSGLSSAEIDGRAPSAFSPHIDALQERVGSSAPKDVHRVFKRIFDGGMPKLLTSRIARDRYYSDYVNTYIERDIRDLSQVGKLREFYDFLVFTAARTGCELKYSEIAGAIGISAPTAKQWVSLLESCGIIYILRPYYTNLTSRIVKTPKMYFMDTGLAAYLCRWPTAETLENGAMNGNFFETYAVSEIVKSYLNAGLRPDLYYYRDIDRKEIDLLIVEGDKLFPIEIKKAKSPASPDKNFGVLDRLGKDVQPGLIICMSDGLMPYSRNAWHFPVWAL